MTDRAQFEIKRKEETEATIQVTIAPEEVAKGLDSVYRRYSREVRIPGFRKGHVPRHLLDSRFGREAFLAEAKDDLQRQYASEAITELDLRPVSTPRLEEVSHAESEPLVFNLTFSILPDVKLPELGTLEVTIPASKAVDDNDIQQALTEVQTHFSTLAEKEGDTVAEGDIVRVREGEQEWDTRAEEENPFTKHLIGATVGADVEIDTELPDGKRFHATLSVVRLQQIVLPEIDEELARDAGFDDLAALKSDIDTKLSEQRAEQHLRRANVALLDALVDRTEIPLPDAFLDELVEEEIERIKGSSEFDDAPMSFAEYLERRETDEEGLSAEIRDSIAARVRRELVLRQLGRDLKVSIDDDELGRLAEEEAKERDEEPIRFVAQLKANDRWDDYRSSKINERIFAVLRDAATVREEAS